MNLLKKKGNFYEIKFYFRKRDISKYIRFLQLTYRPHARAHFLFVAFLYGLLSRCRYEDFLATGDAREVRSALVNVFMGLWDN